MRCWQPYGLSAAAQEFLNGSGVLEESETSACPHCGKTIMAVKRLKFTVYKTAERGFGESDDLEEWSLQDGRKARRVQDFCVWSSGPMTFDCLEIDGKKEFQWTAEEASAACGEEIGLDPDEDADDELGAQDGEALT